MPAIIPVRFTYAARDLWFDPAGTGAQEGDHVICSTERGKEFGLATADAREVTEEELAETIGHAQLRPVLRIATDADLERAEELERRGEESMPAFRHHVTESGLDMKPVGVEYLFDGDKAVCYFAAEERVDFRQLVRDLAREFHVRIDMRQIGVREEAAIVGGYGHCGQELCCRRFAMGFDPVSIRMAKEQDLPLNSTKISGACGRLMCCLRYEFEAYRDFKSRAPKRNAVIDTPLGKGKIIEYDTPKEQICLRLESGKQIRVALADMTASEAAHKKSEELGCPCRPDTVAREVLDRLDSPDVQMALAELDRKNGVLAEPEVDASDLFVETRRKRRRGSGQGSAAVGSGEPGRGPRADRPEAADEAPTRRRRKRRPGDGGGAAAQPQAASQSHAAPQADASAQPGTRRRRHHHAAEASADAPAQQPAKRTRRPGDKGGGMQPSRKKRAAQQAQSGEQRPPAPQQAQGQQRRAPQHMGGQQGGAATGPDGAAKPRRRRRRGGRGRGGAPDGGAPSGSGE
ncbi:PSP1 domain-containing protein [Thermophilibacter mediterraneus]|uniref:PSP1 domain-containing protein n=1 Tax=Thermophilibacter mediterraneus TaxID=1871031 RepID=UPI003207CFF5